MSLRVYTARVSYGGGDRLDVTRKSAPPEGLPFAPSWAILKPALDVRERLEFLRAEEAACLLRNNWTVAQRRGQDIADLDRRSWTTYVDAYTAEMRASYRANRAAWDALLARAEVTLVCYCTDPQRCHRTLLAGLLGKCGAVVRGEREAIATGPTDREKLRSLLACERLTDEEHDAFQSMLDAGRPLSTKQRQWVDGVRTRLELDADDVENLFSTGRVAIGRPVALAPVLRNLPKAPPGRPTR